MRLIDADALKDSFCEACSTKKRYKRTDAECRTHSNALYGYSCFKMRLIDTAPTIDAEPVVRCKDCKHFMEFTETFREILKFDGSCRLLVGFTECDREMRKYTDYCISGAKMDAEVEHD